jgi:hypothetical protein
MKAERPGKSYRTMIPALKELEKILQSSEVMKSIF